MSKKKVQRQELLNFIQKNECQKGYQEGCHPHHPSGPSGVTFGPGIDCRRKSAKYIEEHFKNAVKPEQLQIMKKAAGLSGKKADEFVKEHKNFKLSEESYENLLKTAVKLQEKQVVRIMNKPELIEKYHQFKYNKNTYKQIPQEYKNILIDMKYNGRFTSGTRTQFIPALVAYVQALKNKDSQQIADKKEILDKKIIKVYKKPEVDDLKNDEIRGDKVMTYIHENDDSMNKSMSTNNPESVSSQKSINFYQKGEKILKDITNNKNNLGGVDLGFDTKKYRFSGFYFGERGYALKNSIDACDITLNDLVVPLKIMMDKNIKSKNISVSLDPQIPTEPDGPLYSKIYYPQELEGTPIGNAMIEADYLMKQLNLGVDHNNMPFKYPKSLVDAGMDFKTISTKYPKNDSLTERARLWIIIEDAEIIEKNNIIEIGKIKMGLKAVMQEIGPDGKLKDGDKDISEHNKQFVRQFCKNYSLLERQYPVFKEVRKYAKAVILARILLQKRCTINNQLIQNLYISMKSKEQPTKKRLQNKIQIPTQIGLKIRRICGGCNLNINKPSLINKLPMKTVDTNIVDLTKNYNYFIFQELQKCIENNCDKFCNTDYYSVSNKQCRQHSKMRCPNCLQLIMLGEKYLPLNNENINYHPKCIMCSGCENQVNPEQLEKVGVKNDLVYHTDCYPVGMCDICNCTIKNGQKNGSLDGKTIHMKCFEEQRAIMNQNMPNGQPSCQKCKKIINGAYKSNGTQSWHPQCYVQPKCEICNKPSNLSILNEKKVHLSCLSCVVCKKPLEAATKFGCTGEGKYIHIACSKK